MLLGPWLGWCVCRGARRSRTLRRRSAGGNFAHKPEHRRLECESVVLVVLGGEFFVSRWRYLRWDLAHCHPKERVQSLFSCGFCLAERACVRVCVRRNKGLPLCLYRQGRDDPDSGRKGNKTRASCAPPPPSIRFYFIAPSCWNVEGLRARCRLVTLFLHTQVAKPRVVWGYCRVGAIYLSVARRWTGRVPPALPVVRILLAESNIDHHPWPHAKPMRMFRRAFASFLASRRPEPTGSYSNPP